MNITASELLAKLLKQTKSDTVFGIPSYVGMKILQDLKKEGFKFILNSHEENAVYAAIGYYYATGLPGIVSLATGPGLTNAITGIAEAYIESVPLIVIAGRPYANRLGRNEYHANSGSGRTFDEQLLIRSSTKKSYVIDSKNNAIGLFQDAFRTALTQRPGPVFISLPPEIQKETLNIDTVPLLEQFCQTDKQIPDHSEIEEFQKIVLSAKKPIFLFGKEANSSYQVLEKVLKNNAPYFTSYGAKGKVPLFNNYLGTCWYSNTQHIHDACKEADLLIVVGDELTHFSIRGFSDALKDKIIQVHPYAEEIGRGLNVTRGFVGKVKYFLESIAELKKPWNKTFSKSINISLTGQYLELLSQNVSFPLTYFSDVGNCGYASITDLSLSKGQNFFTSGKFGVCGSSIPLSVGYSYANPNNPVLSLIGDLSFLMNMQEIVNIKSLKTKNSFLVFNNHGPQNISGDQLAEIQTTIHCDMPNFNLKGIADLAHLYYQKINNPEEFLLFIKKADFLKENYLVDLEIPLNDKPLTE